MQNTGEEEMMKLPTLFDINTLESTISATTCSNRAVTDSTTFSDSEQGLFLVDSAKQNMINLIQQQPKIPPQQQRQYLYRDFATPLEENECTSSFTLADSSLREMKMNQLALAAQAAGAAAMGTSFSGGTATTKDYTTTLNPTVQIITGCSTGGSLCKSLAFPIVLHYLLDHADEYNYDVIISWQYHGRAFHVHDPDRFVSDVMPHFFQQTRFSSFLRQLALYDFHRVKNKSSPDDGCYYHDHMLRGHPKLCTKINRARAKGSCNKYITIIEPNFDALPVAGLKMKSNTTFESDDKDASTARTVLDVGDDPNTVIRQPSTGLSITSGTDTYDYGQYQYPAVARAKGSCNKDITIIEPNFDAMPPAGLTMKSNTTFESDDKDASNARTVLDVGNDPHTVMRQPPTGLSITSGNDTNDYGQYQYPAVGLYHPVVRAVETPFTDQQALQQQQSIAEQVSSFQNQLWMDQLSSTLQMNINQNQFASLHLPSLSLPTPISQVQNYPALGGPPPASFLTPSDSEQRQQHHLLGTSDTTNDHQSHTISSMASLSRNVNDHNSNHDTTPVVSLLSMAVHQLQQQQQQQQQQIVSTIRPITSTSQLKEVQTNVVEGLQHKVPSSDSRNNNSYYYNPQQSLVGFNYSTQNPFEELYRSFQEPPTSSNNNTATEVARLQNDYEQHQQLTIGNMYSNDDVGKQHPQQQGKNDSCTNEHELQSSAGSSSTVTASLARELYFIQQQPTSDSNKTVQEVNTIQSNQQQQGQYDEAPPQAQQDPVVDNELIGFLSDVDLEVAASYNNISINNNTTNESNDNDNNTIAHNNLAAMMMQLIQLQNQQQQLQQQTQRDQNSEQ